MILTDSVDLAHAPVATNDSERLLFRHLFQTLVRIDCKGQARPGLAAEWSADSTRRVWTFTLRQKGRVRSSPPITAGGVVSAWEARQAGMPARLSLVALDDRRVQVTLSEPSDSIPRVLADPAFAIAVDSAGGAPAVEFQKLSNQDPRDALDRGADLMVTRDPALIDYVATRTELATFPLPWSRTYVLLQPASTEPMDISIDDDVRRSLARDAVVASARAAEPPYWWAGPGACAVLAAPIEEIAPRSPRIVYPAGDKVARGLAERLVALASSRTKLRTTGLEHSDLHAAVLTGGDFGYVMALPRQAIGPCPEWKPWPSGFRIRPLIDTRAHAIVRHGSPPLTVDWDGTVRVAGEEARSEISP